MDRLECTSEQPVTAYVSLQVDTWFGASTSQADFAAVTSVFDTMAEKATNSIYNCPADSADFCDGNTYAYVYPSDSTQTIYMCQFTFNYPVGVLLAISPDILPATLRVEIHKYT